MERVELRPPRNPYAVPESSMTKSRKMSPETDPIMSEEDLAFSVQRFRTDSRVLVMLAVSHENLHTPAQIKNYFRDLNPQSKEVLSRELVVKILSEFSSHGIIEESPGVRGRVYSRPSYIDTYLAQAGYLADFSSQYPVRLSQIFGRAEALTKQSSPSHSEGGYTHDRIRILRKLYALRRNGGHPQVFLSGIQAKIASDLSLEIGSVKGHLASLASANMFEYVVRENKGSYQEYALSKDIPDYKGEEIPQKQTVRDWVDEYAQVEFYRNLSTDDAFLYVLEHMEGTEDMTLGDIESLRREITKALYNKRRRGEIVPVTNFGKNSQSYVKFGTKSGQVAMLRDIIVTLSIMQREERRVEQEGIKKGRKVMEDPQVVRRLVEKVEADSILHEVSKG